MLFQLAQHRLPGATSLSRQVDRPDPSDLQNRVPLLSLHLLMLLLPYPTFRHRSPMQSPYGLDVALVSFSVLAVCLDIATVIIKPNLPFQSRSAK